MFFLNQQFITRHIVADHGSYFVTTYRRYRQHVEEEIKKGKRKKEEKKKELIVGSMRKEKKREK